jgi:hypothetical protein
MRRWPHSNLTLLVDRNPITSNLLREVQGRVLESKRTNSDGRAPQIFRPARFGHRDKKVIPL